MKQKVVENYLRRVAERRGQRLVKSRRRDPFALDYGKYKITPANVSTGVFRGPQGWVHLGEAAEFLGLKPKAS
jgi:hypothetical protein